MNSSPPRGQLGGLLGQQAQTNHQLNQWGAHQQANLNQQIFGTANQPSEHDMRMTTLAREDKQLVETLEALMALTGFTLESWQISHMSIGEHIDGATVCWRLTSRKWELTVAWIDKPHPALESFNQRFAQLSDAVADRREKTLAAGKPLPPEPISQQEIDAARAAAIAQMQKYAQQQAQAGMAHVFDQAAFQRAAQNAAGIRAAQNAAGIHVRNVAGAAPAPAPLVWENLC